MNSAASKLVTLTQSVIPIGAALFILAEMLNLPDRLDWARGRTAAAAPEQGVEKELSH